MQKLVLTVCIICSALCSFSQETKDSTQNNFEYLYCEILGTSKFMSNKVTVTIDFGQLNKFASDQRLRDESGKVIVFNSMVDAMNWMGSKGWEFIQAYIVTSGNQHVYHWLLKKSTKKLTREEKQALLEDFKTKKDFKE